MTAILTGTGLGLERSSAWLLGSRAQLGSAALGRAADNVSVNAATGNLIVQNTDEVLIGRGPDAIVNRTYNSLGTYAGDNDNWLHNGQRKMVLTGTANAAGSVATLTDWDGSVVTFSYVSGVGYRASDKPYRDDTVSIAANVFTWTEGKTRTVQKFDNAVGGRLISAEDADANIVTYTYDLATTAGKLIRVTTANSVTGQESFTTLVYTGANLTSLVTSYRDLVTATNKTLTRTLYAYDTSNRLTTVTVDLTPGDNAVTDSKTYTTTYTYVGATKQIASITQSDGTSLAITYDGSNRVATLAQTAAAGVTRTTTLTYNAGYTRVTDPLGQVWDLYYDAAGRLVKTIEPAAVAGGALRSTEYFYDPDAANKDDLLSVRVLDGATLIAAEYNNYDAVGNLTVREDMLGNTTKWTYGAKNEVLTMTAFTVVDSDGLDVDGNATDSKPGQASGGMTTRYAYDAENHLRYVISHEGRVTQFVYDTAGYQISKIDYVSASYVAAGSTEADLNAWTAGLADKSAIQRTDTAYDYRGNVTTITSWSRADASGNGLTTADWSRTTYVYDQFGKLLSRVASGTNALGGEPTPVAETFLYDGLGRVISLVDLYGVTTTISIVDATRVTTISTPNDVTTTTTYNIAGERISEAVSGTGVAGTTSYAYDALGRLRVATDRVGVKSYLLYDRENRKTAEVDGDGSITEFKYDAANNLVASVSYKTALTAAQLTTLGDAAINTEAASVRPASNVDDRWTWNVYDRAGRLIETIDAAGAATRFDYDAASRLILTTRYATAIAAATVNGANGVSGYRTTIPTALVLPAADTINDRATRGFYDNDGLLVATLDADGFLSRIVYDSAGRKIETFRSANAAASNLWAAGTLAQLITSVATNANDIRNFWLYDGRGLLGATIDGEGNVTRYHYTARGQVDQEVRGQKVAANTVYTLATLPAATGTLETTTLVRNVANQITSRVRTLTGGTETTTYSYDTRGRLVAETTSESVSTETRTQRFRYDAKGRLIGSVGGVGSSTLTATPTDAQLVTAINVYGTRYAYDDADRLISKIDPDGSGATGNKTLYYYDSDGQLRFEINALGETTEHRYNALEDRVETFVYGTRISTTGLTGGLVNSAVTTAVATVANAVVDSRTQLTYTTRGLLAVEYDPLYPAAPTADNYTAYYYNSFGEDYQVNRYLNSSATQLFNSLQGYNRRGIGNHEYTATNHVSQGSVGSIQILSSIDAFGRISSRQTNVTDARTIVYGYDRADRLISTIDRMGKSATNAYDPRSNLISSTDRAGKVTTFSYDLFNRNVTTTTPENVTSSVKKNAYGQTIEIKDGANRVTAYSYDKNGNLKTVVEDPGSGKLNITTTNIYDNADRLIQSTDAKGVITKYTYDAANRVLTRIEDQGTGKLNLTTTYAYDAKGQQTTITDPLGVVTTMSYDLKGRKTRIVQDSGSGKLNITTDYLYRSDGKVTMQTDAVGTAAERRTLFEYDDVGRLVRKTEDVGTGKLNIVTNYFWDANGDLVATSDNWGYITRFVYDKENRQIFSVNAAGEVTETGYDNEGRAIWTRAYANRIAAATLGAFANGITAAQVTAAAATSAGDYINRTLYDGDGRSVYAIDGEGFVTKNLYDGANNVTKTLRYATAISVDNTASKASVDLLVPGGDPADAAITSYAYDAANRLTDMTDPTGSVTRFVMNLLGQVTETHVAFGTAAVSVTKRVFDNVGRVTSETRAFGATEASTTSYIYDKLGHATSITDGRGFTTVRTYDALGRMLTEKVPVDGVAANDLTTTYQYDARGNRVMVKDARNSVGYFYYDNVDRLILQIDPQGFATETAYRLGSIVASVKRYYVATSGATVAAKPALTTHANDALTQFSYDKAYRLISATDAQGFVESYTLDAFGNRTRMINKLGGATDYGYDKRGLLAWERVDMVTHDKNGTVTATNVRTDYLYDARGNLTRMTKAANIAADALATNYTYDKLDRLTNKTSDQVSVLNIATGAVTAVTPSETYTYDLRGNLIRTRDDATGATSFFYYDQLNRKTAEISAVGMLTKWTYDANSNATAQRIFATKIDTPVLGGAAPADPAGASRDTAFAYDRNNRLTSSSMSGLRVGSYNGSSYTTSVTTVATSSVYDAAGNVVVEVDGNGNSIFHYFDKLNREVAKVDQEKYLTVWVRDSEGNVTQETRYATKIASAVTQSTSVSALITAAGANAANRITDFTYDKNGRRLTEVRRNVATRTLDGAGAVSAETLVNATISYTYNGLGQVTRKVEAVGSTFDYIYDTAGRLTSSQEASFTDYLNATVRKQTDHFYDGLNNLVRTREGKVAADAAIDRFTTFSYVKGRLTSTTDATGFIRNFAYDAAGRVVKDSYDRLRSNNSTVTEANFYAYDLMGRVTSQYSGAWTGSSWANQPTNDSFYNTYGDLYARGVGTGGSAAIAQEFAEFDNLGRVWRTNFGDGVAKAYVYDGNGNSTLLLQSNGSVDLKTGYADLNAIFADQSGAVTQTFSVFDKRNKLVDTYQVASNNAGANPVHAELTTPVNGSGVQYFNSAASVDASNLQATGLQPYNVGSVSNVAANQAGSAGFAVTYNSQSTTQFQSINISLSNAANYGGGNLRVVLEMDVLVSDGKYSYHTEYRSYELASVAATTRAINIADVTAAAGTPTYKGLSYSRIVVYQDAPGGAGRISVAKAEETYTWNGSAYQTNGNLNTTVALQPVLQFQAENPNTAALMMLYRPLGSSGPYSVANATTPLLRADGSAVAGWFVFDLNAIGTGSFDIRYQALDSAGAVLDSKAVTLSNSGQVIITPTAASMDSNPYNVTAFYYENALSAFASGTMQSATSVELSTRPLGSGAGWDYRGATPAYYSGGGKLGDFTSATFDLNAMTLSAPAGYTGFETRFVFRDGAGNQLGVTTGTLTGNAAATYGVSQSYAPVNGPGQTIATWDGPYYTLLFTGLPTNTQTLNVYYRELASGAAFTALPVNPTPRGGAYGIAGWWSGRPPADGRTFEYYVEPRDAGGNIIGGKSYGWFVGGAQPGALTQYADKPEIVTLQPPSGQTVTYQQFRYYSGGSWSNWIGYAAGGNWAFDAGGLVPSRYAAYSYPIQYQTYNGSTLVSHADGTLNLGYGTQSVSLSNAQSVPAKVVFQPQQPGATRIRLYWREGSTNAFTPAIIDRIGGVFAWDVDAAGVRPASGSRTLEYYYDAYDAGDALLPTLNGADHVQGYLTIQANQYTLTGNQEVKWVIDTRAATQFVIHRAQGYNAFGEISSETDGRGNVTTFTYNTAGKLTLKTNPQVLVTSETGASVLRTTSEAYFYDASGRMIGMEDANGNRVTQALLSNSGFGGRTAISMAEYHFDGVTRSGLDVFGNVRRATDALGKVTSNNYDNADRLVHVERPMRGDGKQLQEDFAYDGLGQRIRHTNNHPNFSGAVETTDYDVAGRVVSTKSFGGLVTTYSYTWYAASSNLLATVGLGNFGGWANGTTNSAGRYSQENRDMFGRLTWKQDTGVHYSDYTYDKVGRLVQQNGSTGQSISFAYYNNGYIKSITDNALKMRSTFEYDNDGNRTLETYITTEASPRYYQNAAITYDAQNRITRFLDTKADITYKYDAQGNRRNVNSIYSSIGANGQMAAIQTQDYWYKYDAANRFVLTMGTLSGGAIVTGSMGVAIAYNARGDRATATYGSDGHSEAYTYTEDGYLSTTTITGVGAGTAIRTNDVLGRVTQYSETVGGTTVLSRATTFDLDNRVTSDVTNTVSGGNTTTNSQTYYYGAWNGASYTGTDQNVVTYVRNEQRFNGANPIYTDTYYTYEYWDEAKQSRIQINATNPANPNTGQWAPGFSNITYDVNGHISRLTDSAGNRSLTYQNDAYGQVLVREERIGATLGPRQLYYYFSGKRIGDVGNNGISTTQFDYAQTLAQRGAAQNEGKNGFRGGVPVSSADFDQNYQPINDGYPGTAASIYTVRGGDTLRSIAQSAWGDANLWYLIADANGLTSATNLVAGQRLSIPNKVTNFHNTSETFKPYNPGEAIGDTMPTLPEQPAPPPPPRAKKGCGVLGKILLVVIAVAVAIALPELIPALAPSALGGGVGGAILSGAIGAAAGSVVSQAVGVATGIQSKFSFKSVALAAIAGGVGGGFSKLIPAGSIGGSNVLTDVVRGAASNAVTQGVAVATGLQQKFDWAGVAVGGIVSGVGGAVSRALIGKTGADGVALAKPTTFNAADGIGNGLVSGLAGGIAGAAARTLIEGSDFGDNFMSALPDIIGSTIGRAIGGAIREEVIEARAAAAVARYEKNYLAKRASLPEDLRDNPLMYIEASDIPTWKRVETWKRYQAGELTPEFQISDGFAGVARYRDGIVELNGAFVEALGDSSAGLFASAQLEHGIQEEIGAHLGNVMRRELGLKGFIKGDEGAVFAHAASRNASARGVSTLTSNVNISGYGALEVSTNVTLSLSVANRTISSGSIFAENTIGGYDYYGPAGHYYTTFAVAKAILDKREVPNAQGNRIASLIALGAQIPDMITDFDAISVQLSPGTSQTYRDKVYLALHSLYPGASAGTPVGGLIGSTIDLATPDVYRDRVLGVRQETGDALEWAISKGRYTLAGMIIHRLGDSYAHSYMDEDKNLRGYSGPRGHQRHGHTPDDMYARPDNTRMFVGDLAARLGAGFANGKYSAATLAGAGYKAFEALFAPKGGRYNEAAFMVRVRRAYGSAVPDANMSTDRNFENNRVYRTQTHDNSFNWMIENFVNRRTFLRGR